MNLTILTLYPEFFKTPLETSVIGRAVKRGVIGVEIVNIRQFGIGPHKVVDDRPFGGGAGMVLRPDVVAAALRAAFKKAKQKPKTIYLTPSGIPFRQELARKLARQKQLILFCGHFEGIDARAEQLFDLSLSIGDYVLSGGEPAALVILDAVARLIPGVLGKEESGVEESFSPLKIPEDIRRRLGLRSKICSLLEYPHYTRPEVWEGRKVPAVLLSGDHAAIHHFRLKEALERTQRRRPDLLTPTLLRKRGEEE